MVPRSAPPPLLPTPLARLYLFSSPYFVCFPPCSLGVSARVALTVVSEEVLGSIWTHFPDPHHQPQALPGLVCCKSLLHTRMHGNGHAHGLPRARTATNQPAHMLQNPS